MGIITAGIVFLADFLAKQHVNTHVMQGEEVETPAKAVVLRNVHTRKFFFDTLDLDKETGDLLGALTLGASAALFLGKRNKLGKAGASLLFGGALSSFVERKQKGYVTKYAAVHSDFPQIEEKTFNIPDLAMILGAVLCILSLLFGKKKNK